MSVFFGCGFFKPVPCFPICGRWRSNLIVPSIDTSRYKASVISPFHKAPGKILFMQTLNASLYPEFLDFFISINSWRSIPTQISITHMSGGWYQIQVLWQRCISSISGTECIRGPKTPTASFLGFYNNANILIFTQPKICTKERECTLYCTKKGKFKESDPFAEQYSGWRSSHYFFPQENGSL